MLEDSEISLTPHHLLSNYYEPDTVPGLGIERWMIHSPCELLKQFTDEEGTRRCLVLFLKYWKHLHFSFSNYGMVIKHVSPKVFTAKKMYKEKGRSTDLALRGEAVYILLCNIFYTWKHNSHYRRQQVWLALAHSWGIEIVGEVGRQVQVQKNSFSPTSPAFMFFLGEIRLLLMWRRALKEKQNQEITASELYIVRSRLEGQLSLICLMLVSWLNEPWDFLTPAMQPALPSLHSESQPNPRLCSLL